MTLTEFIEARIAEDEALARACIKYVGAGRTGDPVEPDGEARYHDDFPSYPWGSEADELAYMAGPGHPTRILAECEVKRQIVADHNAEVDIEDDGQEFWTDCESCRQSPPCTTLRILGTAYADHPDYSPEWGVPRIFCPKDAPRSP